MNSYVQDSSPASTADLAFEPKRRDLQFQRRNNVVTVDWHIEKVQGVLGWQKQKS